MNGLGRASGGSAIVRISVVSADGRPLMPCKLSKARSLLAFGKAYWEAEGDGRYHLRLRFNPKSPIMRPSGDVRGVDLDSPSLAELKRFAQSRRVWSRVLSRDERAAVDLSIRHVKKPRSPRLIDMLARIVVKLRAALISPLKRLMGQVGKPIALRLSRIAKGWGYGAAENWAEDEGFIRFLTITSPVFQSLASRRLHA